MNTAFVAPSFMFVDGCSKLSLFDGDIVGTNVIFVAPTTSVKLLKYGSFDDFNCATIVEPCSVTASFTTSFRLTYGGGIYSPVVVNTTSDKLSSFRCLLSFKLPFGTIGVIFSMLRDKISRVCMFVLLILSLSALFNVSSMIFLVS